MNFKKVYLNKTGDVDKRLYNTYVRPHLEYAVQSWNPYAAKDVKTLEQVYKRATKVPNLLRQLTYEERL